MNRFHQSLLVEVHISGSQEHNIFTGRSKAENASDFQRAGFERAAQEYEQAARDEVHVAVAQLTNMFRAELRKRMGALQHQAEQTWTSNQVVFFL